MVPRSFKLCQKDTHIVHSLTLPPIEPDLSDTPEPIESYDPPVIVSVKFW